MSHTFNNQQDHAYHAVIDYLTDQKNTEPFIFIGLAGTGKTTVIAKLLERCVADKIRVALVAPTGKAASVLNSKQSYYTATTVHSVFYGQPHSKIDMLVADIVLLEKQQAKDNSLTRALIIKQKYAELHLLNKTSRGSLKFGPKDPELIAEEYDLIIVDEASMLNEEMVRDIAACEIKTIYVGDDNQLPPVEGKFGVDFTNFDVMLTQNMRQADGSNVLKLSRKILSMGKQTAFMVGSVPKDFAPSVRYTMVNWADTSSVEKFLKEYVNHQHVVYYNEKRHVINNTQRNINYDNNVNDTNKVFYIPKPGELLVVDDNNSGYNLTKGDILEFVSIEGEYDHTDLEDMWVMDSNVIDKRTGVERVISLNVGDLMLSAKNEYAEKLLTKKEYGDTRLKYYLRSLHKSVKVAFPYAITAYKAQGSEWDNVTVDTAVHGSKLKPYMYTAVTRAKQNVVMVF